MEVLDFLENSDAATRQRDRESVAKLPACSTCGDCGLYTYLMFWLGLLLHKNDIKTDSFLIYFDQPDLSITMSVFSTKWTKIS
jgi:hypothetical protein